MYYAEVLGKLPVAQHFLFGTLLPYPIDDSAKTSEDIEISATEGTTEATTTAPKRIHSDASGHLHVKGEGFGDCCGIPIPSRFAAMEEERKKLFGATGVRRIPFD